MKGMVGKLRGWGMIGVLIATLFLGVVPVAAQTHIGAGEVSGAWGAAGSPYLIEGDIRVPVGATLTIEPGAQVIFQGWYKLTVNGTLVAEGTESAPILFTAQDASPGWLGIRFVDAPDGSRLSYVTVERGRATGASPDDSGGAIYVRNSNPVIQHSVIRDNYARKGGGGLYLEDSAAVLTGNSIVNNSTGGSGSAYGGGIALLRADVELTGNLIRGNSVSVSGTYSTPSGSGGAVYSRSSSPALRYNIVSDNSVSGHANSYARGGAFYFYYGAPALINNTITGNSAESSTTGVYSIVEGGGIFIYQSDVTLANNILWNDAPQEIFDSNQSPSSTITVAHSDISGGQAGIVTNDGTTVNWQAGNFDADPLFADLSTGDFHLQADSPAVDAGTVYFEWNGQVFVDLDPEAYAGSAPDVGALEAGTGGGLNQPPVAAAAVNPDHGSAPLAVQFSSQGSYDPDGTIAAYAWDFGDGDGSSAPNPSHTYANVGTYQAILTVTDDAGAAHSDVVSVSVVDGTTITTGDVSGNWTVTGSPYRIEGDVTVPAGATLSIEPGAEVRFQSWYRFTVNGTLLAEGTASAPILFTAPDGGPGWPGIRLVSAADNSRLTYIIVERGRASGASPLDLGGGIYIENSSPVISQSIIRDNYATKAGGGLYLTGSNAILAGNTIVNNRAGSGGTANGGGIAVENGSPQLLGNIIQRNTVGVAGTYSTPYGRGGGIYADRSSLTLQGNILTDNHVNGHANSYARGGALYLSDSDVDLAGNSFYGNSVENDAGDYSIKEGGAVYATHSQLTLANDILWNDLPEEIFVSPDGVASVVTLAYTDLQGGRAGVADNGNGTVNWLQGNIDAGPLFVDVGADDFSLQSGSPAIDAGTAYFEWEGRVLVDLAPDQYLGAAPDMGAVESDAVPGTPPPAPTDALHVEDQVVDRVTFRRYAKGVDTILITDQNSQPVSGVSVTAAYSGPSQGELSGATGTDGMLALETPWLRKPKGSWCFEVTSVLKDGYVYTAADNVVTVQCEAN